MAEQAWDGKRIGGQGLRSMSAMAIGTAAIFALAVAMVFASAGAAVAQPFDKWVDAFFNSQDPFIKGTVIPNIEKNRKSDAQLAFTDADGKPLTGLKVSVRQIEHAFLWGAVPPFETSAYGGPAYLKLWRDVYNFGITESAFKWAANEKVQGVKDFTRADGLLETFRASGAQLELHFLAGYHPAWINALSDADKAKAQREYALAALVHFQNKVSYYQVFNEDLLTHVDRAKVFMDQAQLFGELSKLFPNHHLGINDCYVWNPASAAERFPPPADLKAKYPGIKFIAMHGHRPHSYWATPQEMYKVFDPYTGSGVKVQIAEFGIMDEPIEGGKSGNWTDDLRAQYFISAYATVFSHPATEAFHQWGVGPDTNRWTANYMINMDGTVKPSYNSIKSLVRDKLMTKASGTSDAAGLYAYRGFRGQYEITVEQGGLTGVARLTLGDTEAKIAFKVAPGAGKLILQGGDPVSLTPFAADSGPGVNPGPDLISLPGVPVVFTGLRNAEELAILDLRGRVVRNWEVIGDRVEWDRTDKAGNPVKPGAYGVRIKSRAHGSESRKLLVR